MKFGKFPNKESENGFDHNTGNEASKNENSSTSTAENINDSPKNSFSVLAEILDTLNFFLTEISDIKDEIKNKCNQKTSKEISIGNDEKIERLQKSNNLFRV